MGRRNLEIAILQRKTMIPKGREGHVEAWFCSPICNESRRLIMYTDFYSEADSDPESIAPSASVSTKPNLTYKSVAISRLVYVSVAY